MQTIKLLVSAVLLAGVIFLLNNPIVTSSATIPPPGKFLNPYSGFWANARQTTSEMDIPSTLPLKSSATVQFDDRLVPHIYAENEQDLSYLQGYITAKHRLWQMDFTARLTMGRLSEVLGESILEVDQRSRRMGLLYAAENAAAAWSKDAEKTKNINAYINGINDFIAQLSPKDYPLEFKLMNYEPEEWTMLHSTSVMKAMARTLAGRGGDAVTSNTKTLLGAADFADLYPEWNPKQSPIIPSDRNWDHIEKVKGQTEAVAPSLSIGYNNYEEEDRLKILMGSNNWAVDKTKTADGSTILAGDPHLSLTLPSIWYEAHLKGPRSNAYGVTIAGLPAVIIGFNDDIAWSETNVGHDIIDWFEMKWADKEKGLYYLNGTTQEVSLKIEEYHVRNHDVVRDTVKYAVWGPIWEAGDMDESDKDLAMRWLSHDANTSDEILTFEMLNRAKNFDDYRAALSHYVSPAQNFVFADRHGDIAITVAGHLPLRADQQGRFVQSGDDIQNDWAGIIPFEHNPFVKNPERGFVSSANQHSTSPDYPYYYTSGSYFEDFRGRRLNDLLGSMNNITVDDMADLQYDAYSIKAAEALPIMLDNISEDLKQSHSEVVEILSKWDYQYSVDAQAPVLFEIWWDTLYESIWDEMSQTPLPIQKPEAWRTIQLLEQETESKWFDMVNTSATERMSDVISNTFEAMTTMISEDEEELEDINWNAHRNTRITHLARIVPFSSDIITSDGNRNTLNAISRTTGPSWRMLVQFRDDNIIAKGIYPGGQSGNPGSPYYDNMIDSWAKGEYYDIHFTSAPSDHSSIISTTKISK